VVDTAAYGEGPVDAVYAGERILVGCVSVDPDPSVVLYVRHLGLAEK
jgi:hypothetical protein